MRLPRSLNVPRQPDVIIGGADNPYLRRWWVIPRNRFFNIYLHHFMRSDDDRALHDHPWCNLSILLTGSYFEHLPDCRVKLRKPWRPWAPWRMTARRPTAAHRVQLLCEYGITGPNGCLRYRETPCWTIFLTGPNVREWGFFCPQGWRHWRVFTHPSDAGSIGRGCE